MAIAISIYTAGAASGILSYVNCVANSSAIIGQAFAVTVAGGAVAGAVATGNSKGAVKGALMAAVTFGIGHGGFNGSRLISNDVGHFAAHGVVSGISAEVDGGQFIRLIHEIHPFGADVKKHS